MTNLKAITSIKIPKGQRLVLEDAFLLPDFSGSNLTITIHNDDVSVPDEVLSFGAGFTTQIELGCIVRFWCDGNATLTVANGTLWGTNVTSESR